MEPTELLIDCEEDKVLGAVLVGVFREFDRPHQAHRDPRRTTSRRHRR
jgi:hypothetical protein